MKVLCGYESSGIVRDAFIARGHDDVICNLLPSKRPGPHYQGDIFDILGEPWDLGIFHPPCTYLCGSGLHWSKRRPERAKLTEEAFEHVLKLIDRSSHIPKRVMENSVGILSTRIRKPDQIIQPNQFGHDASKATCLWLWGGYRFSYRLTSLILDGFVLSAVRFMESRLSFMDHAVSVVRP